MQIEGSETERVPPASGHKNYFLYILWVPFLGILISGACKEEGREGVDTLLKGKGPDPLKIMEDYSLRFGGIKDEPWTISHCIIAFGRDCTIEDGLHAIEYLFQRYIREKEVGGRRFFHFPTYVFGDKRCEAHPDQFIKIMIEEGFPADRDVVVGGHAVDIDDIIKGAMGEFRFRESEPLYRFQDRLPFSLHVFASFMKPGKDAWTNFYGEDLKVGAIAGYTLKALEEQSGFLKEAMERGEERIEKKKQGIFAFTCGGAHLFQAAAYAVHRGFVPERGEERIREQIEILFYRLRVEVALYDRLMKERPEYEHLLLAQKLKFLGHFLESVAKSVDWGLLKLKKGERKRLLAAREEIFRTVSRLHELKVFERLGTFRGESYQYYLDIVGDSCHAIKGIRMLERVLSGDPRPGPRGDQGSGVQGLEEPWS